MYLIAWPTLGQARIFIVNVPQPCLHQLKAKSKILHTTWLHPHASPYFQLLFVGIGLSSSLVWRHWGERLTWLRTNRLAERDQPGKNLLKYSAMAGNRTRVTESANNEIQLFSHWAIMTDCLLLWDFGKTLHTCSSVFYSRVVPSL